MSPQARVFQLSPPPTNHIENYSHDERGGLLVVTPSHTSLPQAPSSGKRDRYCPELSGREGSTRQEQSGKVRPRCRLGVTAGNGKIQRHIEKGNSRSGTFPRYAIR
ncbi:hypothetical protein IMZ48_10955 [Candidatus Bathyarchaeota archaeon]|nr:hypothetical protein [Candidatus Bathyarchaeota archaeon]